MFPETMNPCLIFRGFPPPVPGRKYAPRILLGRGPDSLLFCVLPPSIRLCHFLQMGDILDVRKENVCRGSSPEELSAYRKRVRDRLHGERVRQRTARGLPLRRPPRISAVTSRADFPSACRKGNNLTENKDGKRACGDGRDGAGDDVELGLIQDELGREPYLMLMRAKNKSTQEGEATHGEGSTSVPFCSECLGCCQGTCSPGGTEVVKKECQRHVTKPSEHPWKQSTTAKMQQQQQQQVGGLW